MKIRKPFMLSSLSAALLLAACGGGDSSSTETTDGAVISGTVPGTLIEAFCSDGSYYSVHSTDDGSAEHPFSLTVPSGVDCHLVMTTNENDQDNKIITPILFQSGSTISAVINTQVPFNLGYVPLEVNIEDIIDMNGDGVVDAPLTIDVEVPEGAEIREVTLDVLDDDHDGIPNVYEDDDEDGEYNLEDNDDDNDGTSDDQDEDNYDLDGDGVDDLYDRDDDNDGIVDEDDDDDDNDGVRDEIDDDYDEDTSSTPVTDYTPVSAYTVSPGRLLASQCAQCHGTDGQSVNSWDSLSGESAAELIEEMMEFKSGAKSEPIMEAQAHGYSDAEISSLAAWLANQSESKTSAEMDSSASVSDDEDSDGYEEDDESEKEEY